jgi:hypothetical protein
MAANITTQAAFHAALPRAPPASPCLAAALPPPGYAMASSDGQIAKRQKVNASMGDRADTKKTVGFVGLGAMGAHLAGHLHRRFRVTEEQWGRPALVWNQRLTTLYVC